MTMSPGTIVAATQNSHKIREIEAITAKFGLNIIGRDDAGIPDVEIVEDGETFEENSYKKAFEIMKICGRPTIADDSGLEVDCLGGAPGIYSARFAEMANWPDPADMTDGACRRQIEDPGYTPGPHGIDKDNNQKLIDLISNVPYEKRRARFVSVITLVFPDGEKIVARGTVAGHLLLEEAGDQGFGYDPLFVPDGYDVSFGQLPAEIKNSISHRANALKSLEEQLLSIDI